MLTNLLSAVAVTVGVLPETVVSERRIVKRLAARGGQTNPAGTVVPPGHVFLLGDADRSTDSRQFGPVPAGSILGVLARRPSPSPYRERPGPDNGA